MSLAPSAKKRKFSQEHQRKVPPADVEATSEDSMFDNLDLAILLVQAYAEQMERVDDEKNAKAIDGRPFLESQMSFYRLLKATVYGIGPWIAGQLVRAGCSSLDDLTADPNHLYHQILRTKKQTLAYLRHYADLTQQITSGEIKDHLALIRHHIQSNKLPLESEIAGSFRRGEAKCNDIDLVIWCNDDSVTPQKLREHVWTTLKSSLEGSGYTGETLFGGHTKLWTTLVKLTGKGALWRQLDVTLVIKSELIKELIRKTGSKEFRRGLWLLKRMKEKSDKDWSIDADDDVASEQDFFAKLHLRFRQPAQRSIDFDSQRMALAKKELDGLCR